MAGHPFNEPGHRGSPPAKCTRSRNLRADAGGISGGGGDLRASEVAGHHHGRAFFCGATRKASRAVAGSHRQGRQAQASAATDKLIAELARYPSCVWAVAHPAVRAKLARCCCRSHW